MRELTQDYIRQLATIDTPTISNAIEEFGLRCPTTGFMGPEVKSLFPELGVMMGYAVTATAHTTTSNVQREICIHELLQAIHDSPKPAVLILKSEGIQPIRTCVIGELIVLSMRKFGAIGVVTDGCIRDIQQVRKAGFHAFAAGSVVSHGLPSLCRINAPVEISDVKIEPGDLIHGDENGILKIPWECAGRLVGVARKILDTEKAIIKSLQTQRLTPDEATQLLRHSEEPNSEC